MQQIVAEMRCNRSLHAVAKPFLKFHRLQLHAQVRPFSRPMQVSFFLLGLEHDCRVTTRLRTHKIHLEAG